MCGVLHPLCTLLNRPRWADLRRIEFAGTDIQLELKCEFLMAIANSQVESVDFSGWQVASLTSEMIETARFSSTLLTMAGLPGAVEAQIAPYLDANREVKDVEAVDEVHSFFQKPYRTPAALSHAMCVCAHLGKVRQIPFLLKAGADAVMRCTDTERLVHNIVLGLD